MDVRVTTSSRVYVYDGRGREGGRAVIHRGNFRLQAIYLKSGKQTR